jgi:hypothetical protein
MVPSSADENLTVRNVFVKIHGMPEWRWIDVESCKNVLIENLFLML